MQIAITGRHMTLSDDTKEFIEDRVERFMRFFERIERVQITTDMQHEDVEVEIVVHPPGGTVVAKERGEDLHIVVDRTAEKIERSLRRLNEKFHAHRSRKGASEPPPVDEEDEESYQDIVNALLEEET
ncbi:MAG: ribosome-associated translation inhibitor RaiA [Planctomycetota bacterium]|nr:ribosome-associated translation inhibitor RaiA [Planctomycetota bacterium]